MMATYCPGAVVWTVENDPLYVNNAVENLGDFENINIIQCDGRKM